ncbi:MAG: TetR/AcrR family transcriptional regulator [Proteobacteria bacterium]|nr:TetR/AcrR family transcriptional regulator [Pseudomonadota bacterium]
MGTKGEGNRQRIVSAADNLFYRNGYNQTSFQDISDATGIPRGNFYYYFKTKDEILNAVVDSRVAELSTMLQQCEAATADARERLHLFTDMLEFKRDDVLQSGCPIGTLSSELAKAHGAVNDDSASDGLRQDRSGQELSRPEISRQEKSKQVFLLLRDWVQKQFAALGVDDAADLAMDLLARMQGVTVMACAFKDADFMRRSHREINDWIDMKTRNA